MGSVRWTENQSRAIKARNGSVLVSAAAGSGKTAVLVERVIEMITNPQQPIDADRLLVVTYTRAAAGEMKDRIAARLEQLLQTDPLNENLRRQQALLSRASISTIHSFCGDLAREFFYTLDIPNNFRIADEGELTIIKRQALQNVLEQKYSERDNDFEDMVEAFSSVRDDSILQGIILRLYDFLRSHPFPQAWVREKAAMYDPDIPTEQNEWGSSIVRYSLLTAYYMKSLNDTSLKLTGNISELWESGFGDRIRDDEVFIARLISRLENGSWNEIAELLNSYSAGTLRAPKGFTDNEVKVAVSNYRKFIKDTIAELQELFIRSEEECTDDIASLAPIVSKLFEVMELFGDEYSRLKLERALADFSDLEHWALRLLAVNTERGVEFTELSKQISQRYDYVMVDEYQDANRIQDTIFKAVSDNDKKLFVVGDVKQSIYRFRQAMPEIFIDRKADCVLYNPCEEQYPARVILEKNFRSRVGVTDGVNFVFRSLMSKSVGDIEYTDEEALTAGAAYDEDTDNAVSFHLLNLESSETKDRDIEEAKYIGTIIHKMMAEETVTVKGVKRRPTFGDFCILLRGVKAHAPVFEKELLKLGIPSVSEISESFFERSEIRTVLSLLRVIDNPVQDIPLAAVMISPVFGFKPDELAQYRAVHTGGSLYSVVLNECRGGNAKAQSFCDTINRFRKISACVTSDTMLNIIYGETMLPEIMSSQADGENKRDNLRLLVSYAKNGEACGYNGIGKFIRYMDKLKENSCDLAAADKKLSSENAVQIMTIHKSKGLEFPICIVANLNRMFNTDTKNEVLLHNELGLGVRRKDDKLLCRYTTVPREAVSLEIKRNELSEELRVLYVAMTRAKERLVLVGSNKGLQKYVQSVVKKLACENDRVLPYTVGSARCMCDWIVDCMLIHKSGFELRQLGGYIGEIYEGNSLPWNVCIRDDMEEYYNSLASCGDMQSDNEHQEIIVNDGHAEDALKEHYLNEIKRRVERQYQYEEMTKMPVKLSASSVAERKSGMNYSAVSKPDFMQKGGLSGAQRGTAVHTFAQYCDIAEARISLKNEIERLSDKGFLSEEQAQSLDLEKLNSFINSELADRMLRANRTEREFRFTVEVPIGMTDETIEPPYSEELIVLQGAVDCLFEENGKIVIVDYKTDRINDRQALTDRYLPQLKLYRYAVELTTGKEVSECLIYSFAMGESFQVCGIAPQA